MGLNAPQIFLKDAQSLRVLLAILSLAGLWDLCLDFVHRLLNLFPRVNQNQIIFSRRYLADS